MIDVEPDATDRVMAENQFNDPPSSGVRYHLITLEATYRGTEPADFFWSMSWNAVGESAVSYGEGDSGCGTIPNGFIDVPEVFQGGTIEGNICFAVRAEDVDSLVLYLEPLLDFDADPVFFALRPGDG